MSEHDYDYDMITLLFDIDGTLVRTGGAGKAAMETALRTAFGVTDIRDEVPYSGRTDPAIGSDLLRVHGLPTTPDNYRRLADAYLDSLPGFLHQYGGHTCPGITDLVPKLANNPRVRLGLLTGNARRGAEQKLAHFDLWKFFPFGGFGDVHTNRDDVARSALSVARDRVPNLNLDQLWVIGDTPLDVSCARAIGAKALAVATGWHPKSELDATNADLVLEDLADFSRLPENWFSP